MEEINPEHCNASIPSKPWLLEAEEFVRFSTAEIIFLAAASICTSSNMFALTDVDEV